MNRQISKCLKHGLIQKCRKCDCYVAVEDDELPDPGVLVPSDAKQACAKCLSALKEQYDEEYEECVEKVLSKIPDAEKEIIKRFMHKIKTVEEEDSSKKKTSVYEL